MKLNNTYISHNLSETIKFAEDLAKNAKPNDIFCLEGELGVGKTVIAKGIGKFFNVETSITSPTFNILKTYDTNNKIIKKIHHFDLYRIKSIDELYNIGFEDYLYNDDAIVLIEWPDIAKELLPDYSKTIKISKDDNLNDRIISYEK